MQHQAQAGHHSINNGLSLLSWRHCDSPSDWLIWFLFRNTTSAWRWQQHLLTSYSRGTHLCALPGKRSRSLIAAKINISLTENHGRQKVAVRFIDMHRGHMYSSAHHGLLLHIVFIWPGLCLFECFTRLSSGEIHAVFYKQTLKPWSNALLLQSFPVQCAQLYVSFKEWSSTKGRREDEKTWRRYAIHVSWVLPGCVCLWGGKACIHAQLTSLQPSIPSPLTCLSRPHISSL